MESLRPAGNTYRLIVTRRNASEILLVPAGPGWALPRVEIHPHERLAEQLTAEAARTWGLEAFCLFLPSVPPSGEHEEGGCAVMESVKPAGKPPMGTYWMPSSTASECCDPLDASALRNALAELHSYRMGERAGQFGRPSWMRELFTWAQEQIAPLDLRLTGGFRQLNASPTFSLIRLEAEGGAVWFKATGEPNSHELPVTVALTRFFPRYLPPVLGVHQAWNGWLSAAAAGISLDEVKDFRAWERAAKELAELQIESIGKVDELLEAQTRDLRLPVLAERIDPFISRMGEFMAAQEKPTPAPVARSELASLGEALKESCALLESLRLPHTLGHVDFNPGNILVSEDRCVFLDWAEGCITNPLVTFEYLREHLSRSAVEIPAAGERLAAAYLRPWESFHSPVDLRRARELSPLIAVFAYAVATDSWRSLDFSANPTLAGYYRSLTRRMYRESIQVAQRSEPCLS